MVRGHQIRGFEFQPFPAQSRDAFQSRKAFERDISQRDDHLRSKDGNLLAQIGETGFDFFRGRGPVFPAFPFFRRPALDHIGDKNLIPREAHPFNESG